MTICFNSFAKHLGQILVLCVWLINTCVISAGYSQVKDDEKILSSPEKSSLEASKARLKTIDDALIKTESETKELLKKTNNLDSDIRKLRGKLITGAGLIRDHETWVRDLGAEVLKAERVLAEKRTKLYLSRKRIGSLLLALRRVSSFPVETVIVRRISPGDSVRSALLIRTVVGDFDREIISLRDDLQVLKETQMEASKRRKELSKAKKQLEDQRKIMQTLIGRKSRLRRRALSKKHQSEKRLQFLVGQASSIRGLILKLERIKLRREVENTKIKELSSNQSKSKRSINGNSSSLKALKFTRGSLLLPAIGTVIAKFGQKGTKGSSHKGLTLATGLGAQVIAPFDGRVAFAGQFKGYGKLLIIEHEGGYHTLLSGLRKISSSVGQSLITGEPVGYMREELIQANDRTSPLLYMEIRKEGLPINPLPWLFVNEIKKNTKEVSG